MGGSMKTIAHLYTDNEALFNAIQRGSVEQCQALLQKKPQLISQPLTLNSKVTALHRAAYRGNITLMKLFAQKFNADVNLQTKIGETALIAAAKKDQISAIKYLLENGANADFISKHNLKPVEYAILPGFYEAALLLWQKTSNKQLRSATQYKAMAKEYGYRYVNYGLMIYQLRQLVPAENVKDFLTIQRKVFADPVIDPRETWKNWFKRNIDFKDPPLVQRSELPQELQPQNRKFGKVNHFFNKITVSSLAPEISYKPNAQSQIRMNTNQQYTRSQIIKQNLQIQTIS